MADSERPFGRFFLPGPTEVLPEILTALSRPMIGHRGKGMEELMAGIQPQLQRVFRTTRPVYIGTCAATGFMEGALRNGARARVLSLVNGAFSERFHHIARSCGLLADALHVPLGSVHTPDLLRDALRKADYDAVTVVHSETSTGALNPIAELSSVVHETGDAVFLVDSVTGVGGARVETDAWQLDFVLTGSQKALALPPGLSFGVANERILSRAAGNPTRGVYFDFLEFEGFSKKHQTPGTPALSIIYALAVQMERIERETIEGRWARHEAMAMRTWTWAEGLAAEGVDLKVLAPPGFRSPTVTCLSLPDGRTGTEVNAAVKAKGFTIATGYGALRDSTIRIGHMGDHTIQELDTVLSVIRDVLIA